MCILLGWTLVFESSFGSTPTLLKALRWFLTLL